jgi:hypothetical protein
MNNWDLEFRPEENASAARLLIAGNWIGDAKDVHNLLRDMCQRWPAGYKVKYLVTCGGFTRFSRPLAPSMRKSGHLALDSVNTLVTMALRHCDSLLDDNLLRKLKDYVHYLTIGVDSEEEPNNPRRPHIELVTLLDLRRHEWCWTGKSYPTVGQEVGLIRITDLQTHFLDLEGERVMILGCHDLNIFSPRAQATTRNEWRRKIREDMLSLAKKNKPTRVFQHPHKTDSQKTWKTAFSGLRKLVPSMQEFLSAGRWYRENKQGLPEKPRSPLQKVLEGTKVGKTIDIIVWRR